MKWIYGKEVFDFSKHNTYTGFIYQLLYEDEKGLVYTYYGRKDFWSYKTATAKLNGTERKNHNRFFNKNVNRKRTKMEETKSESNWQVYSGSCKYVPKGLKLVHKEILLLCGKPIDLTYWETYILMSKDALFDEMNLNMAIGRNFFAEKVTGSKKYLKGE